MKIITDIEAFKGKETVVTMGTFDGIHMGHFSIIDLMKKRADELNAETVLFTFWPHPRIVLSKNVENLKLLNSLDEKKELFRRSGLDNLIIYPFSKAFASLSSREFVSDFLVNKLHVKHLVFGYDHHFGKGREGSFESLQKCADEFGFTVEQVEAFSLNRENVSSTKIRKLIAEGQIKKANQYLGYNYYLKGVVKDGMKIGRKIGFPTANIHVDELFKLIPPIGVYAVKVTTLGKDFVGMMNIGYRPTINDDNPLSLEVHIFDFDDNIYDAEIEIEFVQKIRDEKKFDSVDQLIQQLNKDKITALNILK